MQGALIVMIVQMAMQPDLSRGRADWHEAEQISQGVRWIWHRAGQMDQGVR